MAPLLRSSLSLGFAFFVMACGGGGSGSGGGDGGGDAIGQSVMLRWRADASVSGYVIHWGPESGVYTRALDVGDPVRDDQGIVSFVVDDVAGMGTVYFAVTSYDEQAQMSTFSNELSATVP